MKHYIKMVFVKIWLNWEKLWNFDMTNDGKENANVRWSKEAIW